MLLLFLVVKSPNWKKLTLRSSLLLSFFPIISIIIIFLIFLILSNHSLHNFHTSFKRYRISSTLLFKFLFMMCSIFFFLFMIFFKLFLLFFEILDVAIPNVPLSDFTSQVICYWGACCSSSLFDIWINCLNLSTFIIEFISHCLFNGFNIFTRSRFFLLSLSSEFFEISFSIILNFFLNFVLILTCMNIISLKTEMHHHLINAII